MIREASERLNWIIDSGYRLEWGECNLIVNLNSDQFYRDYHTLSNEYDDKIAYKIASKLNNC